MDDNTRVLAQLPGELPVSDIHGVDAHSAARQQDIGEAAGRGADVERNLAFDRYCEVIEGVGQLDPAAGNPRVIAPFEGERGVWGELFARLVNPPPDTADEPGEDQRVRFRAALDETLLYQKLVGPPLGRHCIH